jgi:plastocyanin
MTHDIRVRSSKRWAAALITAVAVVGLLVGCSSSKPGPGKATGSGSGGTTPATGNVPTVTVKNFAFTPQQLTVTKGTKVTWKFEDTVEHNVTANDKSFKSGDEGVGGSYTFTFNTPGKYDYVCTIHQYMTGTVTVQ